MSKRCQCVGKKMALLVLRSVGFCVWQNQMCHFVRLAVFLHWPLTFCSYKKLAIFTTNVHTKNECFCHHKTVIRSTKPPISCRCCYRLAFLSVVDYNHFYVVRLCHLSSAFLSGLCVGCFIFFWSVGNFLKTIFLLGRLCKLYLKLWSWDGLCGF